MRFEYCKTLIMTEILSNAKRSHLQIKDDEM